jgi:hypothetical protein
MQGAQPGTHVAADVLGVMVTRGVLRDGDVMAQVLSIEGGDEDALSKAMDTIKVNRFSVSKQMQMHRPHRASPQPRDNTCPQSMFLDVPDGIVQEPMDAEMSRGGEWKGKFRFPIRTSGRQRLGSSSGGGGGGGGISADPLLQHLDTPLPRLIERVDGVRRCSEQGVGALHTGDFSRGQAPFTAFEFFAVMRGEHGARCRRWRVSLALLADLRWQVEAVRPRCRRQRV